MKLNHLFAILALVGTFSACTTTDPDDPNKDNPQEEQKDYGKLYLSQAKSSPIEATLDKADAAVTVSATAYIEKAAKEDISVEFEVNTTLVESFNSSNQKSCVALPSSAYSMGTASVTIKSGTFHAEDVTVTVDPASLEAQKSYLLPLSIKKSSYEQIDEAQKTVFFVFNITDNTPPPTPEVVLTEVLDFGHKVNGEIFAERTSFILNDYDRNCNLYLYTRDADRKYSESKEIGQGWIWDGKPFDCLGFISPNTITFRLGDTFQEFGFNGEFEGDFSWGPGAFIGTTGWAPITWVFQFKELTWLTVQGDALIRYDVQKCDPYEPNHWVIINPEQCGVVVSESGWAGYRNYFCCGNYIFAIDSNNKMFAWPFSDAKEIGERFEMPETWEFQQVIGSEDNHFLCLDQNGKLFEAQLKLFTE